MAILNGNIERHAEAGYSVLHPAADCGFVNGSDAVLGYLSGSEVNVSERLLPARHAGTQRHPGPKRKRSGQRPQTIDEFWNQQEDGWW